MPCQTAAKPEVTAAQLQRFVPPPSARAISLSITRSGRIIAAGARSFASRPTR